MGEQTKNRAHPRSRDLRRPLLKLKSILILEVLSVEVFLQKVEHNTNSPPDLDTTPQSNVGECRQESNSESRLASRTNAGLCPVVVLHDDSASSRVDLYDAES